MSRNEAPVKDYTMHTRITDFRPLARQGEFVGTTVLRYPFWLLWQHFESRGLRDLIRCLRRGIPIAHPDKVLDQLRLGRDVLLLTEWFDGYQTLAVPHPPRTAEDLLRLAEKAEDLAHNDGIWRDSEKD